MSDREGLAGRVAGTARRAVDLVTRGRSHFERVEDVPCRVTVSGVRGKSTVVRWLNEALVARGLETYAKVTGNEHISYHNLEPSEFERDGVVRLYENERELREFWPVDAVVAENQGIREYTTRLANELFDPHVVVLVNVRRDHQSTLGATLPDIARAFTRTVPEGAHVVSGDRNDAINDYLRHEFSEQNVDFTVAEPRTEHPFGDVFGARSAFVVDETLRVLGLDPLDAGQLESYITDLRGGWSWTRLEGGGLVCNGAMMNDIESTELLRQHLVERLANPTITPFVFLRRDRAGRTAAFVHYVNWLADNDFVDRVHVAGTHAKMFARRTTADVIYHDHETAAPESVLDACLDHGHPVYLMGNTVHPFMRALDAEIERRAVE
ncbi:hypothetical protein LPA44_10375 [Halobacterium sp. KA-4]|jgi:hypothetical protein|uniref:hypothetical protein n=1 Tax=Halobacterium sp. KA-4 TaxID=2896367 RepID=UPI001E2942AC|nr:hypothetical protein [Halobacterium sp. KA-4]MCD2200297.1 hypothetical protein [Halobacterium sp. KA-4]